MQCSFYTYATKNSRAAVAGNTRLSRPGDGIHIHLLRPDGTVGDGDGVLDVSERQRAGAFLFGQDRDLYIAAHGFLRRVLSRYTPVPPKEWHFICNVYGKPAIANPGYQWLQFNLSHTHGMVACAVANNRAVGVDVERRRYLADLPALCRQVFSPLEAEKVLSHQFPDEREHWFFSYWTLKEAYIKARGVGLSLPLQAFSLVQDMGQGWRLTYGTDFDHGGESWSVGSCLLDRDIYLAHCTLLGSIKN